MNAATENNNLRPEQLKEIIRKLHDGARVEDLKKEFARIVRNTTPEEIADVENALIEEGFPPEEIQRLCDVHVQVFEDSLRKVKKTGKVPGHPVHTMIEENREAKKRLKKLVRAARKLKKRGDDGKDRLRFIRLFEEFGDIRLHFQRKENQLFPALEARRFTGPTRVMWGKHDEIRDLLRLVGNLVESRSWRRLHRAVRSLSSAVRKLIFLEEKILFPTALRKLTAGEWARIRDGEPEIGYAWVRPGNAWDAHLAKSSAGVTNAGREEPMIKSEKEEKNVEISRGRLTVAQLDLILQNLPVDITFVDREDRVRYYSDTAERIFPRSPEIIGRSVQNCHPQKSVHVVNQIVESFKKKEKTSAEFWIQQNGAFVHIRYFPLYDKQGEYQGVIEVSQEVSAIRKLKGEKRLLDW